MAAFGRGAVVIADAHQRRTNVRRLLPNGEARGRQRRDSSWSAASWTRLFLERTYRHVALIHPDHVAAFLVFRQIEVPMRLRSHNSTKSNRTAAIRIHCIDTLEILSTDLAAATG